MKTETKRLRRNAIIYFYIAIACGGIVAAWIHWVALAAYVGLVCVMFAIASEKSAQQIEQAPNQTEEK